MDKAHHEELAEDKVWLITLYQSAIERMQVLERELERSAANYLPLTHATLLGQTKNFIDYYAQVLQELVVCEYTREQKKVYGDLLRVLYADMGAVLASPNWQSPSFWHSQHSQAGTETGTISVSTNDYKRDMHEDEKRYGQQFVRTYVDYPMRLPPFAYPTSSGMSAVATVLISLQGTMQKDDVVLAGKSSYFQNKWQLEKLFPGKLQYVDEFDTTGILEAVQRLQPALVFLDTLCGAESLPIPNLSILVPKLSDLLPKHSTLVLDNTVRATSYQPLRDLPLKPLGGMKLIVVESLLKFHQFGCDRVPGGIIWAPAGSEQGLFETRMHMGTMMPDSVVHTMPAPNRPLFDARLMRIGRNAQHLARMLHEAAAHSSVIESVIHPSLPHYLGYAWTKDLAFQGPFITLRFKEGKQKVSQYDAFVSRVQKIAKEKGVDIVGGTSFGFDTTRLYVTARYATGITNPFVRISVGTETIEEIEALARVFEEAFV